jgi:glycosyltransferase involved in cell wall biosynthesis
MSQESAAGRPSRRIAIYDDAPAFGGHELMLCRLLEALRAEPDRPTLALFAPENRGYLEEQGLRSTEDGRFRVEYLPFSNPPHLGNLAVLLSPSRIRHVAARLRAFAPDTVLVAQGGIDFSAAGVLAGRLGGWRTLSYIPNLNGYARNAATRKNRWRDRFNRPFHRLPHEFVVIREGQIAQLRALGFRGPAHVVYNGIDTDRLERMSRQSARAALGLEADAYWIGLLGRIDLANKGQDLAVRALRAHPEAFAGARLLFVGDGPDQGRLEALIAESGCGDRCRILPFRPDLSAAYAALDLLLIPSLSEGMPLVMVEAMSLGLPIVATAADGMLEALPSRWLHPAGDAAALAARVAALRLEGPGLAPQLEANSARARELAPIPRGRGNGFPPSASGPTSCGFSEGSVLRKISTLF